MKYAWIFILVGVYGMMWCNFIDEQHKLYWDGINFQKVFLYVHLIALAVVFVVSLFMFMKG